MKSYSSYLPMSDCQRGLVAYTDSALRALKHVDYDAVVVRGVSGITVGTLIAAMGGKALVVVRKPHETSHGREVEGPEVVKRWVFVDDLIESGDTIRASATGMETDYPDAVCAGAYLYNWDRFKTSSELRELNYIS